MCKHQGNEVFSSQLLTTPQRSTELGRNLVSQSKFKCTLTKAMPSSNLGRRATGSNPGFGFEYGGQSDGVTPEPIPNSEDKPVHVPYCTQVREPSGTADRCHIHLTSLFEMPKTRAPVITVILIRLSHAARSAGLLCARNCGKLQIAAMLT